MGINEVIRQQNGAQFGGLTGGGGPHQERQVDMGGRDARGALAQPRRRAVLTVDQKLLLLGTLTTGLLAINTALLALLLVRA